MVNISVFNALSIGSGLVVAVKLCNKQVVILWRSLADLGTTNKEDKELVILCITTKYNLSYSFIHRHGQQYARDVG